MNPLTRTPHSTCHQHTANRCRLYYRKGRWTGKSSFLHLSNNTHFYTPTPKLNKQPSEMDFIGNHRKTTFVHLQISTQTHSQRSQTQHSVSTQKPIAIRQPNLYIASQQTGGFSATNKRRNGNFLFNITRSYTQTPSTSSQLTTVNIRSSPPFYYG